MCSWNDNLFSVLLTVLDKMTLLLISSYCVRLDSEMSDRGLFCADRAHIGRLHMTSLLAIRRHLGLYRFIIAVPAKQFTVSFLYFAWLYKHCTVSYIVLLSLTQYRHE